MSYVNLRIFVGGMQRYNSTIKFKAGICPKCDDEVKKPLISGLCQRHYWEGRSKAKEKKAKKSHIELLETAFGTNSPQSELILWYSARIMERTGFCMECGERIPLAYAHASIAHILPKSLFPSVSTHPLNGMELGAGCGCHSRWDKSWESAQKMKVYPLAKERFKQFEHLIISSEERRRIPECFV